MKELGNGIDFEVAKFCQKSEQVCNSCGSCGCVKFTVSGLAFPIKTYDQMVQKTVDEAIEELMSGGLTREEAVLQLLQEDIELDTLFLAQRG